MKLSQDIWDSFSEWIKNKLVSKFDSTILVPTLSDLDDKLKIPHKGFYGIVFDSSKKELAKVGFLKNDQSDLIISSSKIIEAFYTEMQSKGISQQQFLTGSFNFTIVWDVVHINNGLAWNENEDGITFEWGDRYKGMYLPDEIKNMTIPKIEIMNKLCSHVCGVPSNLWRLPEGMVHRMICDSYTI